jgi:hypothetical protein
LPARKKHFLARLYTHGDSSAGADQAPSGTAAHVKQTQAGHRRRKLLDKLAIEGSDDILVLVGRRPTAIGLDRLEHGHAASPCRKWP